MSRKPRPALGAAERPAPPVRPRVGIPFLGIPSLRGGGGAERFFADVVHHFAALEDRRTEVFALIDERSLDNLREIGRLCCVRNLVVLPAGSRFEALCGTERLRAVLRNHRIDLLHIPLISPRYLGYLWFRPKGPAVCISQVDAAVASYLASGTMLEGAEQYKSLLLHELYLRTLRLDGILTWYRRFEAAMQRRSPKGSPLVRAARSCFVDTERFQPRAKEDRIVFAGRLVESKRPVLFVEVIAWVAANHPALLDSWAVELYGAGALEGEVRRAIKRAGLSGKVTLRTACRLDEIFGRSRIFVSTQAHDNFTSLSMLEAMAAGNAIVAFDVGQTEDFVRTGENGVLVREETAEAMGRSLGALMADRARLESMGRCSRSLCLREFTVERFCRELEDFWLDVLQNRVSESRRPGLLDR